MRWKRFIASAIAGLMAAATLTVPAAASEAPQHERINTLTYEFEVSGAQGPETLGYTITTVTSWTDITRTTEVIADGTYSLTYPLSNVSGLRNFGYLEVNADSLLDITLTQVTLNEEHVIPVGVELDPTSTEDNGTIDIWNDDIPNDSIVLSGDTAHVLRMADELRFFSLPATTEPTDPEPRSAPGDTYTPESILTASGDELVSNSGAHVSDSYNGFIQSNAGLTGQFLALEFSVGSTPAAGEELFTLRGMDSDGDLGAAVVVTPEISNWDSENGTFTTYLAVADVLAGVTSGRPVTSIYLSFVQEEPVITLLDYREYTSNEVPSTVLFVTEEDLLDGGLTQADWAGAANATPYIRITQANSTSVINAMIKMGPDGEDGQPIGKASSKYLEGRDSGRSGGYAIQDNVIGAAGTGIYKFPVVNINRSLQADGQWSDDYLSEFQLKIEGRTPNTHFELLGIVFNNGKVWPEGFEVPRTEATSFDAPGQGPGESLARIKLGFAMEYADTMSPEPYTAGTWDAFQAALATAQGVYANEAASDDMLNAALKAYQTVKANLQFVPSNDPGNPLPFRKLTNDQVVYEMGSGINLGNTMDGHSGFTPNETAWQSAETTKAYLRALHEAGFNTIRIPVTWGTMINDEDSYRINANWLSRVQDIVDYAVSLDMYAIINVHHDGAEQTGWLRVAANDIDAVYEKYEAVWRQIAEHFKDYDEHLIFESMNEVTSMADPNKNSPEAIDRSTPVINNLNQIFVNTIRATGSNNEHRWLAVAAHYANSGNHPEFKLPDDSTYNSDNRLMFKFHVYKHSTSTTWTYDQVYEVVGNMRTAANKFNVPMIMGEFGNRTYPQEGTDTGYNDVARAYFNEIAHKAAQALGVVPTVWDQHFGNNGELERGLFSYWNRHELRPIFPKINEAMIRGTYLPLNSTEQGLNFRGTVQDPEIIEVSELSLSANEVTLRVGDNFTVDAATAPANHNDPVLWSTDDEYTATVTRGIIRARGIGETTIRAYSQSGSVAQEIRVVVLAEESANPIAEISVADALEVLVGRGVALNALPDGGEGHLTYRSADPAIATVNSVGKVVGVSQGRTHIAVTASTGATELVEVVVQAGEFPQQIDIALHALYNDSALKYWGTEIGAPVTVTGDGQYTAVLDLDEDLSWAGESAGVEAINKLTAMYLRDHAVSSGDASASPILDGATIDYDAIVIDGQAMTLRNNTDRATMNGNVFDTGEPLNGWTGNLIEEASTANSTVTLTATPNARRIEVTFTLTGVEFAQPDEGERTPAVAISPVGDAKVEVAEDATEVELQVQLTPADTDSVVTFHARNQANAWTPLVNAGLDENGIATAVVSLRSAQGGVIRAVTEDGLFTDFTIMVAVDDNEEPGPVDPGPQEPGPVDPEPVDPEPTNQFAQVIPTADVSGDGIADLLAVDHDGVLWLYRGKANGGLSVATKVGSGWGNLTISAPGDFNSDGHPDLLAKAPNGDLFFYAGNGTGGFAKAVKVGWNWGALEIIPAGDVTGDGVPDVLAIDEAGVLYYYAGDGKGGFTGKLTRNGQGWVNVDLYPAGDLNGDGNADILSIRADGTLHTHLGRGDGGFSKSVQTGQGWAGYELFAGSDVNGDGFADLYSRDATNRLWFYAGKPGGFRTAVQVGVGW